MSAKSKINDKRQISANAFTLAEVLLTLTIIGVIASMVVPSIMANIKERSLIEQSKVANATINNLFMRLKADYYINSDLFPQGESPRDGHTAVEMISKYTNPVKICPGSTSGCMDYTTYFAKDMAGSTGWRRTVGNFGTSSSYSTMTLANGISIALQNSSVTGSCTSTPTQQVDTDHDGIYDSTVTSTWTRCGSLIIDINGPKAPNTLGQDTFWLVVYPDRLTYENSWGGNNSLNTIILKDSINFN